MKNSGSNPNFFTNGDLKMKTTPWVAASLFAATSVFSQSETLDRQKLEPQISQDAIVGTLVFSPNEILGEPSLLSQNETFELQAYQVSSELSQNSSGGRDPNGGKGLCLPIQLPCQPYVCKPEKCGNVQEPQVPAIPAYNAPAEINTGLLCEWNLFSMVSFLYWQPLQEDMRLATQGSQRISTLISPGSLDHGSTIDMDFDYKPAFKIAMGMNFRNDDWVGYIEYTRFRGTDTESASVPNGSPTLYNVWGDDPINSALYGTAVFNALNANFKCKLDFIDTQIERVYYVGQRLTFHSVMGVRVALIAESLKANYTYDGVLINNTNARVIALPSSLAAIHRTTSWGVGPRMGLEMDWLVNYGFRFFGSGFADILYTSYKLQSKSVTVPFTSALVPFVVGNSVTTTNRDTGTNMLRTHLDLELGLGWGRYFDYNNLHLDMSAAYGFQVFFNQNMMRLPEYSPSDLYIQGLNFTVRVDY